MWSYLRTQKEGYKAGYAVVTHSDLPVSNSWMDDSVQVDELVDLTRVCQLTTDKRVPVYIDSRYALGVTNDLDMV